MRDAQRPSRIGWAGGVCSAAELHTHGAGGADSAMRKARAARQMDAWGVAGALSPRITPARTTLTCDQSACARGSGRGARKIAYLSTTEPRVAENRAADSNSRYDGPSLCAAEPPAAPSAATSTSSARTIAADVWAGDPVGPGWQAGTEGEAAPCGCGSASVV